ncbi:GTPase-associated protein 1-related protein [Streptomyces sp. NPDC056835]|uniref:GTPase-associated protein 1-related protein n=1 Tax=Streptomyces sp. NPDC056835 TaxID=3345956 RepID=UPI00369ADFF0
MSLAQLHYTSAPQGPDGPAGPAEPDGPGGTNGPNGPGSRFTAITPGIPRSLLKEAEPLLGYEPPRDAPEHPGPAELAAFPQAFSHSLLSDGTRLLARAVRTGADGSGGPAGSHTHAVLLPGDAGLPGGGLPISAWNSSRWALAAPADGSPAQLEALPPSGLLGREALVGFAASRGPWLPGFLASLRELTEEASGPRDTDQAARIVLVERDSSDVALWIALACAVLPRDHAERLTFTTYTRRPRDARQLIVGVLPGDAPEPDGRDHRCRVHDCTAPVPAAYTPTDIWAGIAARVWLGRAPELFAEAAALPGGVFSPGALAVVALCADLTPGPDGRTAAAGWAHTHARALGDARLRRLVEAFQAGAEDRTTAEFAALTRLFTALPEDLGQRLATGLAPELRAGVADSGPGITRPVELLRVADALGVDCTDLLPGLAHRLAHSLLGPVRSVSAGTPDPLTVLKDVLEDVLEEHFELRTALLSALDALAAEDPPAAVRLLGRTPLALTGVQALPHLRMCAGAPWAPAAGGGDGLAALHAALRACGVSPFTDPLVLRTAVQLVWDGGAPAPGEARRLLSETGSDAHRAAGTWRTLVRAALDGPADTAPDTHDVNDADAAALAHDLLRCFPDELEPRVRGALLFLEFAGEIGAGRAGPPWTERVLALRAEAEPVEPALLARVFGILARRLLSEDRPEGELYALIHRGEPELLSTYATAAQEERVRDRLRTAPAYAADCFIAWSSLPGANRAWDTTRTSLLDKVLRPVVRALSDEDTASVERVLERAGVHRAEEFRAWNRPGALSRLSRRFGGRGRPR